MDPIDSKIMPSETMNNAIVTRDAIASLISILETTIESLINFHDLYLIEVFGHVGVLDHQLKNVTITKIAV